MRKHNNKSQIISLEYIFLEETKDKAANMLVCVYECAFTFWLTVKYYSFEVIMKKKDNQRRDLVAAVSR